MSILVIIGDTLKFLLGKILNFLNIDDAMLGPRNKLSDTIGKQLFKPLEEE